MSLETMTTIICDGCGERLQGPVEASSTGLAESYWKAKRAAKEAHWMFILRYGKTVHLCPKCSDSNVAIPKQKQGPRKRCPKCKRSVRKRFSCCPHCGENFSDCKVIGP